METNIPVWSYYQPGWVDPMFVPYLKYPVKDNWGNVVPTNTWEKMGYADGTVNPAVVRKNWGLGFARMFEDDPCPVGFVPAENGYCFPRQPDNEAVFYTEKAFLPKKQYWSSYVTNAPKRGSDNFDFRSVNPNTGNYTVYYESTPNERLGETKYGRNPTKNSYLV